LNVDAETPSPDGAVELTARIAKDGDRFLAVVDGLDLEVSGVTLAAAENALVQVVRGWLERQDTAGRLADALGLDDLDDETEIVLQIVDETTPSVTDAASE
jgi:hypothetical protein